MDNLAIFLWVVTLSSALTLVVGLVRNKGSQKGPLIISLIVLLITAGAWLRRSDALACIAVGVWIIFSVLPGLLGMIYQKRLFQQNYEAAGKLARVIALIHPFDGWREQPQIVRAMALAQEGQIEEATQILERFQNTPSPGAISAVVTLFRMTNRWEELLAWSRQLPPNISFQPSFVMTLLRAHAETGDTNRMVELYDRFKTDLATFPPSVRDLCRLTLFAFTGRRELVEKLFATSLVSIAEVTKEFWRATAEIAAGDTESGKKRLEAQLSVADPLTRIAIGRRLTKPIASAASLSPAHVHILQNAEVEHRHDQVYSARPSLAGRRAISVQVLIALNVLVFGFEIFRGGATNPEVLYSMGAMYPPAVRGGEWWRIGASMFLHFGALHLGFNMLALWALGPFVELTLGARRFISLYFIAGLGSMFVVMALSPSGHEEIVVGASGAVLGLVGATAGLMLKGWLRERAQPAKRRLFSLMMILAIQTVIDTVTPQISATAHLSGALIGFIVALALRDRLLRA